MTLGNTSQVVKRSLDEQVDVARMIGQIMEEGEEDQCEISTRLVHIEVGCSIPSVIPPKSFKLFHHDVRPMASLTSPYPPSPPPHFFCHQQLLPTRQWVCSQLGLDRKIVEAARSKLQKVGLQAFGFGKWDGGLDAFPKTFYPEEVWG
jgi:hypothetical protein